MIFKHLLRKDDKWKNNFEWEKTNSHETVNGYIKSEAVFCSNEKIYFNENFKGGRFETVFGSQEIDLRKCVIQNNETAYLDLSVVFGNYKVWVPAEWTIKVNAECVFSTVEDRRLSQPENADRDMLVIEGKCVFSSLEIRS
jgi:predicted membrane protein